MYAVIGRISDIFMAISGFGMALAIVRVLSEERTRDPKKCDRVMSTYIWLTLITTLPTLGVYFLLSPFLSVELYEEPRMVFLMYLAIGGMIFSSLVGLFGPILQSYQKIPILTKLSVSLGSLALVFVVVFTYFLGLEGLFLGGILTGFFSLVTYLIVFRRQIATRIKAMFVFDKGIAKYLVFFGAPTFLASFLVVTANWLGVTLLKVNQDFLSVGYFNVASSISAFALVIPGAIVFAFLPIITELWATDRSKFEKVFYNTIRYVLVICFPILLAISLFSTQIIDILYSQEFASAAPLLVVLSSVTLLICYASPVGYLYYLLNQMKRFAVLNLIWFSMLALSFTTLVPIYGALGLVFSLLIVYLIHMVFGLLLLKDKFAVGRLFRYLGIAEALALIVLLVGLSMYGVHFIEKVVFLLIFGVSYLIVLKKKILTKSDEEFLKGLGRSIMKKILR